MRRWCRRPLCCVEGHDSGGVVGCCCCHRRRAGGAAAAGWLAAQVVVGLQQLAVARPATAASRVAWGCRAAQGSRATQHAEQALSKAAGHASAPPAPTCRRGCPASWQWPFHTGRAPPAPGLHVFNAQGQRQWGPGLARVERCQQSGQSGRRNQLAGCSSRRCRSVRRRVSPAALLARCPPCQPAAAAAPGSSSAARRAPVVSTPWCSSSHSGSSWRTYLRPAAVA